jgi:3-isopropylmalate/(R)-2-methylmalate dehydratase large subunit
MANMAIEAGAKNGIFEPDEKTKEYVNGRSSRDYKEYFSDEGAKYAKTYEIDCEKIEPQVAFPHSPQNIKPVSEAIGIPIDQVVIGSCTNGRYSDLKEAADIMKGHKVHPDTRLIVIPGTQQVYKEAMTGGLFEIFLEAEAVISPPTCGPCLGGHMGVLAEGERAVATTNRNFVGRMGHTKSEVYLSNPAVAAASAIKGNIAHPKDIV